MSVETTEAQHCLSINLEHSVLRDKAAEVGVAQLWRIFVGLDEDINKDLGSKGKPLKFQQ